LTLFFLGHSRDNFCFKYFPFALCFGCISFYMVWLLPYLLQVLLKCILLVLPWPLYFKMQPSYLPHIQVLPVPFSTFFHAIYSCMTYHYFT
jgi:hypothetical protein